MLIALLSALVLAAEPAEVRTPITLVGGSSAVVGPPSVGGGVGGRIVFNATERWSIEAGARESLVTNNTRLLGTIVVAGRYRLPHRLYVGAGFAHNHETPWLLAKQAPVQVTLGSAQGITHRSGLHGNFGVDWPLHRRLGLAAQLTADVYPDMGGPPVYMGLEVGLTLDVGKPRG